MKFEDVSYGGSDFLISLTKFRGKIKDVVVFISTEFGDPMLEISRIVFEDGEDYNAEGEHDIAYLSTYERENDPYNEENLTDLLNQSEELGKSWEG